MGVSCPSPIGTKKTRAFGIPTIDLSLDRSTLSDNIVKACQEYGFFKVVNHSVSVDIISKLEQEGVAFFAKPNSDKIKAKSAGPPTPFGYGCRNIGFNGDMGELEYLLLQATPPFLPPHQFNAISHHPSNFSSVVEDYIEAVKELTCELLELLAQGLWLPDTEVFSNLIKDVNSDSCFRINHYPPIQPSTRPDQLNPNRIGFGEHSDPQIFTILRSNDVPGLQIATPEGLWIPVTPDPSEFCVFVGDVLEVLTNGRFRSVRHRVMGNTSIEPRMSMMYFGAPALNAWISPVPQMVSPGNPKQYKKFTWSEYKKAAYSLRLGDERIDLFKCPPTLF